jgi:hypothetical protein
MSPRRLNDRYTLPGNVFTEVFGRGDPVFEVVFMKDFLETNGDGFQIPSGQAAIRGKSFCQDQ